MKKLMILLLAVTITATGYSQFILAPNNFVDVNDNTKDYVVIDVPDTKANVLFNRAKKYFNTFYNNPKYVSSEVAGEQIVIDAIYGEPMVIVYNWAGKNQWIFHYKIDFQFKDNKVKFQPNFKYLENEEYANINLIGDKVMGINTGMFNKKGKITIQKGNDRVEKYINWYLEEFKKAILEENQKNDEW